MGDTFLMGDVQRLIAFDLDGTLVDSRRDLADSANELIGELGGAPLSEEAIGRMVGEGAAVLVQRALAAAGIDAAPRALPRFLAIYSRRLTRHTRPYDAIDEAVVAARGVARVIVLTNKPAAPSREILAACGLIDMFDEVIGDDGSSPRKPDPAGFLDAMRRAGTTPAHSLLVGDSSIDHETAIRASSRCCVAAYGFGYAMFARERLKGDEWIAATPRDLPRIFSQFRAASA
jgi:phosphoglycolate phosphatase